MLRCVSTIAGLLVCFAWGSAQDRYGAIAGRVVDQSGGSVPGAVIRVVQTATNAARTAVTDGDGFYRLERIPLGIYQVTAEKEGMRTSRHEGVSLEVDHEAVVDHRMVVGELSSSIVVTGEARIIEASPSAISSVVNNHTIERMPLNGRDYIQLATLMAGVPAARAQDRDVDTGYGTHISISGSRPFQNSFRLDGLSVTTYNGSTPGSVTGLNLGVDAILEFSVLSTAYSAQYGQAGGGIINAVTRSGTNVFHGAAFYFHRNDNVDARNFFDGEKPPEFRRHQFGVSLGGPVRKDKTFFFANHETLLEERGNTTFNTTLSAEARKGNLTSGSVTVDPAIARILPLYPLPNGAVFGDTGFYVFANNTVSDERFVTSRLDHCVGDRNKLFFRYSYDGARQQSSTDFEAGTRLNRTRHQSAVAEHTWLFSSTLLQTARAGFSRNLTSDSDSVTRLPETDKSDLEFIPGSGRMGSILVVGLTDFPGGSGSLGLNKPVLNSFQASDDFTHAAGRRSLKWGARLERTQFNMDSQNRQYGDFRFRDLNHLLRNIPDRFRAQFPGSDTVRGFRQWIGALYIEESRKLFRRLTMQVGLRWEWATVPTEVNGKLSNLDLLSDLQMRTGEPLYDNPSWRNLAPRVGLAWDLFGSGATLVRSGYGVFPDLLLSPYVSYIGVRNSPFFRRGETRALVAGDFPKGGYRALLASPTPDLAVDRIPRNLRQPYVQQWNFNVEQRIGPGSSLRVAYVGSHGLNLSSITNDANIVKPVQLADGRLFFPAGGERINPVFGGIRNREFDAHSFYHGLQTDFQRRLAGGLQAQLAYTFSKSIDDSSNFYSSNESPNRGVLPLNGHPKFNRGLSGHDVRHYFTAGLTWDLPGVPGSSWNSVVGGWQAGTIVVYASGVPTTAWLAYDAAQTKSHMSGASIGQRPDLAPEADNNPVTGDPQRWVDISGFRRPEPGFLGNLGRNTISGPDLATVDLSISRRLMLARLGEGAALDLRFEFFNLFNRVNFDLPAVERMETFTDTSVREDFGRITSAGKSREIQFGLKLRF